jgi:hypothetical protein
MLLCAFNTLVQVRRSIKLCKITVLINGYPNKPGNPDGINFGGRHLANKACAATNLTMEVQGFDTTTNRIIDADV